MTPYRHIRIFRYSLPLKKPIRYKKIFLRKRTGYLIAITARDGFTGLGEAAPLDVITFKKEKLFHAAFAKARAYVNAKKNFPKTFREFLRFVAPLRRWSP